MELKRLRAQSVDEVSAHYSCVQFSRYVEMKVENVVENVATPLAILSKYIQVPVVQKVESAIHWTVINTG